MRKILTLDNTDRDRPAITVDFDATLWDIMEAIAVHVAPSLGLSTADAYHELNRSWGSCHDLLGDRIYEVFAEVFHSTHMHPYGLFPGAAVGLRKLVSDGYRIVVMTHRPPNNISHVAAHLAAHGAPVSEIHCGLDFDKIAASRAVGAHLIIDDKPATIAAAHADGLPVVTLRWPYNASVLDELGVPHGGAWDAAMLEVIRASVRAPGVPA